MAPTIKKPECACCLHPARFSELGDFVVKGEHTVYFATGDYSISGADRNALADLAKNALAYQVRDPGGRLCRLGGYRFQQSSAEQTARSGSKSPIFFRSVTFQLDALLPLA